MEPQYYQMDSADLPPGYGLVPSDNSSDASSDCKGGSSLIWIIMLVLAVLVIIGLIVWLVYMHHRDTKGKLLVLTSPKIKVTTETSIIGSWVATGDAADVVTLWATTSAPEFSSDGKLITPGNSARATPGATSVSLDSLAPRIKYFATLILTNPSTSNYQAYTQVVYMDPTTPISVTTNNDVVSPTTVPNSFAIEDILQVGRLQVTQTDTDVTNNTGTVSFVQSPTESESLWVMNAKSQIQSKTDPTLCLFSNNGVLAAGPCEVSSTGGAVGVTGTTQVNSTWVYNPEHGTNKWCLQSTSTSTTPTCMVRNGISKGTATVSVTANTRPENAWANSFEVAK